MVHLCRKGLKYAANIGETMLQISDAFNLKITVGYPDRNLENQELLIVRNCVHYFYLQSTSYLILVCIRIQRLFLTIQSHEFEYLQ